MTTIPILVAQSMPSATSFGFWWSVAGNVALVITVIVMLMGKKEKRVVTLQPPDLSGTFDVRTKGRRFSSESCDIKHANIDHRLDGHDAEISKLWCTMREEDAKTRAALACAVRDFDQTVSETKGVLSTVNKTNDLIMEKLLRS